MTGNSAKTRLFERWKSVEFLLQIADDEVQSAGGNDVEKNMSAMNPFYIKGKTARDLDGGKSRWEKAKSLSSRNF